MLELLKLVGPSESSDGGCPGLLLLCCYICYEFRLNVSKEIRMGQKACAKNPAFSLAKEFRHFIEERGLTYTAMSKGFSRWTPQRLKAFGLVL